MEQQPSVIRYTATTLSGDVVELSADEAELKQYVAKWSPYWELRGGRLTMRQPRHLYRSGMLSLSRQLLMFAMAANKDLAVLNAEFPLRTHYAGRRFGPLRKEYELWEAAFAK